MWGLWEYERESKAFPGNPTLNLQNIWGWLWTFDSFGSISEVSSSQARTSTSSLCVLKGLGIEPRTSCMLLGYILQSLSYILISSLLIANGVEQFSLFARHLYFIVWAPDAILFVSCWHNEWIGPFWKVLGKCLDFEDSPTMLTSSYNSFRV